MTGLQWLGEDSPFPPTSCALREPNGLLAGGGGLSPNRLLDAYRRGIFPWFEEGQPVLWWSPSPRMTFTPGHVHCSRSMAKTLRKAPWEVRVDANFTEVIQRCAGERRDSCGTWISPQIQDAYITLFKLGYAHSIEVYQEDDLAGGLYGISLGKVFFGESMFSLKPNTSKCALITLSRWLANEGFALIDCQVANPHLISLGAQELDRTTFEALLHLNISESLIDSTQHLWQQAAGKTLSREGHILP